MLRGNVFLDPTHLFGIFARGLLERAQCRHPVVGCRAGPQRVLQRGHRRRIVQERITERLNHRRSHLQPLLGDRADIVQGTLYLRYPQNRRRLLREAGRQDRLRETVDCAQDVRRRGKVVLNVEQ